MTVDKLKDSLYEIIQGYFTGAEVAWSEQNAVKSTNPLIRLKLGSVKRASYFINQVDNDVPCGYIPSTTILTVDLFTHGEEIVDEEGFAIYVNTAISDMEDFINYLQSPHIDDMCERLNISIRTEGDAKDTSAVLDNDYSYRAMQEFVVNFVQETRGYAGISRDNWKPTSSGGGTVELANKELTYIEKVNIEESQH